MNLIVKHRTLFGQYSWLLKLHHDTESDNRPNFQVRKNKTNGEQKCIFSYLLLILGTILATFIASGLIFYIMGFHIPVQNLKIQVFIIIYYTLYIYFIQFLNQI